MEDGFYKKLEELSREQREKVGKLSSELGFDGSPHITFDDLVPKKRKLKKFGRKKGSRNLTIRERLLRRYEE
jgi:mRNA-degrading endonuclease RelE of RelBE toxin-antitoxin system